jgi:hypothetical protein
VLSIFPPRDILAQDVAFSYRNIVTNVGSHTIDDENTEDGETWLEVFQSGADIIPGVRRACWATSYRDPHIAMHFIGKPHLPWCPVS